MKDLKMFTDFEPVLTPKKRSYWWLWGLLLTIGCLCIFTPPYFAQGGGYYPACRSNLAHLSMNMEAYAFDHDDVLPLARWRQAIDPLANVGTETYDRYSCPEVVKQGKTGGYAYNRRLVGKRLSSIPDGNHTILLFETATLGYNQVEDPIHMLPIQRHAEGRVIAYAQFGRSKDLKPDEDP